MQAAFSKNSVNQRLCVLNESQENKINETIYRILSVRIYLVVCHAFVNAIL